jgi:hypothetical protein
VDIEYEKGKRGARETSELREASRREERGK